MTTTQSQTAGLSAKLYRLTVNLTEKAHKDLEETVQSTGMSKTDTVNRALIVNAWIESIVREGGSIYVEEKPGELQKVKIF